MGVVRSYFERIGQEIGTVAGKTAADAPALADVGAFA
jgi:hypothetical protein